ncbi:hypothetical protein LX36DRAFT_684842 [Colletotrichum falcatum]|nr:hypothetical protein LX36DRAFT_684842 [Colletotrichum falcatum]
MVPGIQALPIDVLSRHGSISLMTIFIPSKKHVYLVDVHALQSLAFLTATDDGTTLKTILESPTITKVFFDLMENAAWPGRRRFVIGLEKCIDTYAPLSNYEKLRWKAVKEAGLKLCHPKQGGLYEVFNIRPIQTPIQAYCINDVQYLPQLREILWRRLNSTWREKVKIETQKRVLESQSKSYEPQSVQKRFGPWECDTTMGFNI